MKRGMQIAFFGSSLVSAYWNGAATYYRGIIRALHEIQCVPSYNALAPSTHYPVPPDPRFEADLGFLGNRMPDREWRVEQFFFAAAAACPDATFLLGGSGWESKAMPPNVQYLGH